jgi:pimeloyl-ACP methyl ester carboxylesterase
MEPVAGRLAARYRVLAPDLPGFGRSDKPPRALDVAGLAGALGA